MATHEGRRRFVVGTATTAAVAVLGRTASAQPNGKSAREPPVTPTEDLMREHGVLRRVILVYREGVRLLEANMPPPPDLFANAAGIVRTFIEGYHEKVEEDEVFPRLEKAGKLGDLTRILRQQHDGGRKLTETILRTATASGLAEASSRQTMIGAIQSFIRMYEPHAAREDTVLFPAFRELFTAREFDELGEKFEAEERRRLGRDGFEGYVKKVAELEKVVGIADLAEFTPR